MNVKLTTDVSVKRQAMDRSGAPHVNFGHIKFRIMDVSSE